MRISLLLQREPFGQILEKTLARFWQAQYGQPYRVRWYAGRPNLQAMHKRGEQPWLCNIYLNAIFTPDADQAILGPIRREFARSVVAWRRPLQRAYVALAASRQGAPWLAQAGVGVTPAVPEAAHKLIVAGNHKLRILDHQEGLAYGILKEGFNPDFVQGELDTRRQAAQLGLPVPELREIAADSSWFSERHVSGTPINRLVDANAARDAAISAANALSRLLMHTQREEMLDDYVAGLYSQIQALVEGNHLLSEPDKQAITAGTNTLIEQIGGLRSAVDDRITTALTHGDFQPANILVNEKGVWLIDWEYAARRQIGYDALVFGLHSRFSQGLAARLHKFVAQGSDATTFIDDLVWAGVNWRGVSCRRLSGSLFLLEELVLHLKENDNSAFFQPGFGLVTLATELSALQSVVN